MPNKLIPVFAGKINNQSIQLADARLLHSFLEVGKDFSNWIKDRIKQYDFSENTDYIRVAKTGELDTRGLQGKIDYHITLDMAKELSMVERNAKGKQARQYFIECEKQAKSLSFPIPQTFAEALMLAAKIETERQSLVLQIEQDKPKVEFAMAIRQLDGSCTVEEFAKTIAVGKNKVYAFLRESKILMPNNYPYQRYIDNGWLDVDEEKPFIDPQGRSHPRFTTRITGKGQVALEKKLRKVSVGEAA